MDTNNHSAHLNNSNSSSPHSQQRMDNHPTFPSLNLAAAKSSGTDGVLSPKGGQESPCTPGMVSSPIQLSIPSPIITKRTRTNSTYDRAMENPIEKGRIKSFNRGQGHGFIVSDKNGEEVFVHVSDIEGEYVPKEGDEVSYRVCPIPPKLEKHQAIHVRITNFTPDVHLRWDSPLLEDEKNEAAPPLVVD